VWHIRGTIVEFQCQPTLIFATCWQIPSIFLLQNCHRLNLSANLATLRATFVAYQCQKGGISMPPYFYFCHLLK